MHILRLGKPFRNIAVFQAFLCYIVWWFTRSIYRSISQSDLFVESQVHSFACVCQHQLLPGLFQYSWADGLIFLTHVRRHQQSAVSTRQLEISRHDKTNATECLRYVLVPIWKAVSSLSGHSAHSINKSCYPLTFWRLKNKWQCFSVLRFPDFWRNVRCLKVSLLCPMSW